MPTLILFNYISTVKPPCYPHSHPFYHISTVKSPCYPHSHPFYHISTVKPPCYPHCHPFLSAYIFNFSCLSLLYRCSICTLLITWPSKLACRFLNLLNKIIIVLIFLHARLLFSFTYLPPITFLCHFQIFHHKYTFKKMFYCLQIFQLFCFLSYFLTFLTRCWLSFKGKIQMRIVLSYKRD